MSPLTGCENKKKLQFELSVSPDVWMFGPPGFRPATPGGLSVFKPIIPAGKSKVSENYFLLYLIFFVKRRAEMVVKCET